MSNSGNGMHYKPNLVPVTCARCVCGATATCPVLCAPVTHRAYAVQASCPEPQHPVHRGEGLLQLLSVFPSLLPGSGKCAIQPLFVEWMNKQTALRISNFKILSCLNFLYDRWETWILSVVSDFPWGHTPLDSSRTEIRTQGSPSICYNIWLLFPTLLPIDV